MARVKHTGDLVGTPHGTRRLPKPEPRPKPDIEAENFNEEDAARLGAVLYDLAWEAIKDAMTPIPSVGPEDREHRKVEPASAGNESRPSHSTGPRASTPHVRTNPARREITAPATGVETAPPTAHTPAVEEQDSPNRLLRPLKRKLKDLEAEWGNKEYVSKLKHKLSDVKERNAELVEYVVELEDMVEALQAELKGK